ncbi:MULTISPECIES: methionyl-tRNA formyltransferase [Aminobacterium]|mgnify:FL=1|jgi:methionyl-tRNA formyltransferase|uniref:methionyl-tRNA formyltransferase n=1 Tax=Aminobacterium TaxID=81466 RepID=UPI002580E514|nr:MULTISPECIES: methionyl-tRNA formyltransferase [unclassified Aminobacterium]
MISWFIGAGSFAALCLRHLTTDYGMAFDKIITSEPTRGGRGMKERPSLVEEVAKELGFPVCRTGKLSQDNGLKEALLASMPEIIVVVDFGQKVLDPFLSVPRWGCLNIHPSLLPQYRGAAPVQRAIMDGCQETGVSVFRLVEEMDAGPILGQKRIPIDSHITSGELFQILAKEGGNLLKVVVKSCIDGNSEVREQNSKLASYAPKIEKRETYLDWNQKAAHFHNLVRALNPQPGAYVLVKGRRLKIWKTALGDTFSGSPGEVVGFHDEFPEIGVNEGSVLLLEVQPEGRRVQSGAEWSRGIHLKKGDYLDG